MSKRLQVLIPDEELVEIQNLATREQLTVGEYVRRTLRTARENKPVIDAESKLKVVREAVKHSFPTADIDQMLKEIERGYEG